MSIIISLFGRIFDIYATPEKPKQPGDLGSIIAAKIDSEFWANFQKFLKVVEVITLAWGEIRWMIMVNISLMRGQLSNTKIFML